MGTAPPSKPVSHPYHVAKNKHKHKHNQGTTTTTTTTTTTNSRSRRSHKHGKTHTHAVTVWDLMVHREWQQVLIRCDLCPEEAMAPQWIEWGVQPQRTQTQPQQPQDNVQQRILLQPQDKQSPPPPQDKHHLPNQPQPPQPLVWNLLPLHVCVALQPPPAVVDKLLSTTTHNNNNKHAWGCQAHVYMMKQKPTSQNHPRQEQKWRRRHVATNKKRRMRWFPKTKRRRQQQQQQQHELVLPHDGTQDVSSHQSEQDHQYDFDSSQQQQKQQHPQEPKVGSKQRGGTRMATKPDNSARARTVSPQKSNGDSDELEDKSQKGSTDSSDDEEMEDYVEAPRGEAALDAAESFSTESSSSSSSLHEFLEDRGMALQLGTNGTVEPYLVSNEMRRLEEYRQDADSILREYNAMDNGQFHPAEQAPPPNHMQWDLDFLLDQTEALLPLHVACLYRASPEVLQLLLEANPQATKVTALGMLPIHMVAAGFDLPPPVAAPLSAFPFLQQFQQEQYKLAESLQVLAQHSPTTLHTLSESNGMTPIDYIQETMEDGPYKRHCINILEETARQDQLRERYHSVNSTVSSDSSSGSDEPWTRDDSNIPFEIMCDDDSTLPSQEENSRTEIPQPVPEPQNRQRTVSLYSLIMARKWMPAFHVIADEPEQASAWQYGIEMDHFGPSDEPQLYKRLPIHHACTMRAPVDLLEALFQAYPKGLTLEDPYTGDLPLHLACRHDAPPELVETLLDAHPRAARQGDKDGRVPLHWACLAGSSLEVVQSLIKVHPHSVSTIDKKKNTPLDYAKMKESMDEETLLFLTRIHKVLDQAKLSKEGVGVSPLAAIEEEHTSGEPSLCGGSSDESIGEMLRGV